MTARSREIKYRMHYRGERYGTGYGASKDDAITRWLDSYPDEERRKFDRALITAERVK